MEKSGTVFEKLKPLSKKMRIVSAMKKAIVSGSFQSGDQLVEIRLAEQFGVGQTLVREALIELEHQGFVQRLPFSRTQVTRFSNEDARDIFDIRIELEPLAFSLATSRITPEQIIELWCRVNNARDELDSGKLEAVFEQHLAYRRHVWELAGNRFLANALERLVAPLYALYLMRADFNRQGLIETIRVGIAGQEETLRAFETGNAKAAAETTRRFLQEMKESLGSRLLPTSDRG